VQLEMPSLIDALGIALIVIGIVLLCGTLILARRSSPGEPDKDEAEHNEREDDRQRSDTPGGGRRTTALETDPDGSAAQRAWPAKRNDRY
jgi:hypothetical protein